METTLKPMAGGVYFDALLNDMSSIMDSSARSLEHKGMTETTLHDYLAHHSLLTSLAAMELKRQQVDFEGRLNVATVSFKEEVKKLEKEHDFHVVELLESRKKADGLEMKL